MCSPVYGASGYLIPVWTAPGLAVPAQPPLFPVNANSGNGNVFVRNYCWKRQQRINMAENDRQGLLM